MIMQKVCGLLFLAINVQGAKTVCKILKFQHVIFQMSNAALIYPYQTVRKFLNNTFAR